METCIIVLSVLNPIAIGCGNGLDNCDRVNGQCIDTDSGFVCVCNNGYRGNGSTCGKHVPIICLSSW